MAKAHVTIAVVIALMAAGVYRGAVHVCVAGVCAHQRACRVNSKAYASYNTFVPGSPLTVAARRLHEPTVCSNRTSEDAMALAHQLTTKNYLLKALLLVLGGLYVLGGALPKHWDYWVIRNIAFAFAIDPANFLSAKDVAYPPTFFILQGAWLALGSLLFHYPLVTVPRVFHSFGPIDLGIFPFWGMIPVLTALFLFTGIAYKTLQNKWLALICFGPITFVSVVMFGQIDVVAALFIFTSMVLLQRALRAEKYVSLLLLSYLTLGVSMQFKTFGGLLLPIYVIYTTALVRTRRQDTLTSSLPVLGSCVATFLAATFVVWLPYLGWFSPIMLHGKSMWLVQKPSLLFQVPIWLPGYALILGYAAVRVFRHPLTALYDGRYFALDAFAIVAWFFIAVFTHLQWWIFIVPGALVVLDSFRSKSAVLFCVSALVVYFFYAMFWPGMVVGFISYGIPAVMDTAQWFQWAFILLAGLLLFWVVVLVMELNGEKEGSKHNRA